MTTKKESICIDGQGRCELSGDVTLKTVAHLYQDSLALFKGRDSVIVNFSKISSFDSAIISLILSWLRARKNGEGQETVFESIPEKLRYLITAYKLDEIIRVVP